MDWRCDEKGRPRLGGIHDASLVSLRLDTEARALELRLRGVAGERLCFLYEDVEMLNGHGLWEAAIVNTVFVWKVSDVPERFIADPSAGWRPLFEERMSGADEIEAERSRQVAKLPHGCLSTIVCSFGGNISVLAGSLRITEWTEA